MDLGIFEQMEAPQLREYLRHLLWHYRVLDGYWFLCVENKYDRGAAEDLDAAVWSKIAGMQAKDVLNRFNITEKGLKGLSRALEFCPWTMIVGYKIRNHGDYLSLLVPE